MSPILLDVQKKVCLMHIGKGRGWIKKAYSIVLMQMHANVPGDRERERGDAKQHRVEASPGKETDSGVRKGGKEAAVEKGL